MNPVSSLGEQWRRMIQWGRNFDATIAARRSEVPTWHPGDRVTIDNIGMYSGLLAGRSGTLVKRGRLPNLMPGWVVDLDEPVVGGGRRTRVADIALRRPDEPSLH